MQKGVIFGDRKAGIVEVPDPKPKENWAVVKVHATAMCTEYKTFVDGGAMEWPGHEGAGEVVAVAQPATGVSVGDRVVILPQTSCGECDLCLAGDWIFCEHRINFEKFAGTREGRGTFAQYVLKPAWLLKPIPDGLSYEKATMVIDGIGTPFGAFRAIGLDALDTVLITGLGAVGLGAVVSARFLGARVIGVEPVAWRRERAVEMGAVAVFDPRTDDLVGKIRALTGGHGVDCAADFSGVVQAQRLCIDAVRLRGRVAMVGESHDDLTIQASRDLLRKGITIVGNWCFRMQDLPGIFRVIAESPLTDLLISHVMPMARIQEAFELLASGQCGKVVLKPWE